MKLKILILGASGMLGHKLLEILTKSKNFLVKGTISNAEDRELFPSGYKNKLYTDINAYNIDGLKGIIRAYNPDYVINCIGLIKQKKTTLIKDFIYINAFFPHILEELSHNLHFKVITMATDCVFDGSTSSSYIEDDLPTCHDPYGMSKYLGELHSSNSLTIRTSIIGHEIKSHLSLIDWFLHTEDNSIKGYSNAFFSGLTTLELSNVIKNILINHSKIYGLYHLSSEKISKYDLLMIVKNVYHKKTIITNEPNVYINRTLNSAKLKKIINYHSPSWEQQINELHENYVTSQFYR